MIKLIIIIIINILLLSLLLFTIPLTYCHHGVKPKAMQPIPQTVLTWLHKMEKGKCMLIT